MSDINDEEEQKNYECLVIRAASYEKSVIIEQNQSIPVLVRSNQGKTFFLSGFNNWCMPHPYVRLILLVYA